MLAKIKNFVKYNKKIYKIYFILGSTFFKFIGYFTPINRKKILFVVYGGERYDDSPRFVYEEMKNRKEFEDFEFVWAFKDPNKFKTIIGDSKLVKIDTLSYYLNALSTKYWITNSSCSRGLNFKNKKTINIMFSHGQTGIKTIGKDINNGNESFNNINEIFDVIITQGKEYEKDILKRAWDLDSSTKLLNIGLPRNDEMANISKEKISKIKKELGIPKDKLVLLYAPTFREYNKDSNLSPYLSPPLDFSNLENKLGDKYVLIVTAHYEVQSLLNLPNNSNFIINAFKYPYINDLILSSDILITDYSSIYFDFCITEKPVIAFSYDYTEYKKLRGVYNGYSELFYQEIAYSEKELLDQIEKNSVDYDKASLFSKKIKEKYIIFNGDSTEKFVDYFIYEVLNSEN